MIDKVDQDIISALKNGDKPKAQALKMLKNALNNARIAKNSPLCPEEEVKIVRKEINSRVEARDIYTANARQELASKEEYERKLFECYMPEGLSESQLLELIRLTSADLENTKEFSKLMPTVMKNVAGRSDGKTVSNVVKKFIEGE
jgi:uncharacterized protein